MRCANATADPTLPVASDKEWLFVGPLPCEPAQAPLTPLHAVHVEGRQRVAVTNDDVCDLYCCPHLRSTPATVDGKFDEWECV